MSEMNKALDRKNRAKPKLEEIPNSAGPFGEASAQSKGNKFNEFINEQKKNEIKEDYNEYVKSGENNSLNQSETENKQTTQGQQARNTTEKSDKDGLTALPPNLTEDIMKKFLFETLNKLNSPSNKEVQIDKHKENEELMKKIEKLENEKASMMKHFSEQERILQQKISYLESQLLTSDKADIILFEKQNKEYEIKISNLQNKIASLVQKHNEEKHNFTTIVGEVMLLKDKLNIELSSLEKLKKELIAQGFPRNDKNKVNQSSVSGKVELVLKYDEPEIKPKIDLKDLEEIPLQQSNANISRAPAGKGILKEPKIEPDMKSKISVVTANKGQFDIDARSKNFITRNDSDVTNNQPKGTRSEIDSNFDRINNVDDEFSKYARDEVSIKPTNQQGANNLKGNNLLAKFKVKNKEVKTNFIHN